jgi:hypothetical protein
VSSFDYESMVQKALRQVVYESLKQVETSGLTSSHHFYITIQTNKKGVKISNALLEKHPEEITIVLQHQFWDLKVDDKGFSVTLSFDNSDETLYVPYTAITRFLDPYVKFGLEFIPDPFADDPDDGAKDSVSTKSPTADSRDADEKANGANVITMDQFRKK